MSSAANFLESLVKALMDVFSQQINVLFSIINCKASLALYFPDVQHGLLFAISVIRNLIWVEKHVKLFWFFLS